MPGRTTWADVLRPGDARSFFDRDSLPAFDPTATGYTWQNAWWLAEASRLIYRRDIEEEPNPPLPTRASFYAQAGLRQVRFFNAPMPGTQGSLLQADGASPFAVLVFRGTEQDIRDFLVDLDVAKVPFDGGEGLVHQGFLRSLDSVWGEVADALDHVKGPVFYAGHSLGAALATLAAARRPPQALYTFGSPRVGDEAFVAAMAGVAAFRVVDDLDGVTIVPPEELGFRHVGAVHQVRPPPTASFWANPLTWLHRNSGPPKPLADHAPINYVERIHP